MQDILKPPPYDLLLVRFNRNSDIYRFPLCEVADGTYDGKDKDGLVIFITKDEERHLSLSKFHKELEELLSAWGTPRNWVIWPCGEPADEGVKNFLYNQK